MKCEKLNRKLVHSFISPFFSGGSKLLFKKPKTPLLLAGLTALLYLSTVEADDDEADDDECEISVAIVGAGMSGLVAADELEKLGCKVVVFEKESRVGGKVFTYAIPNFDRPVELGAVIATDKYSNVLDYVARFNIPIVEAPGTLLILDEWGNKLTPQQFLLSRYSPQEVSLAIQSYVALLDRYADFIASPGFTNADSALALNFTDFAKRFGIEPIAELVRSINVGIGYAYPENVPAAYYVKFLPLLLNVGPNGIGTATPLVFPNGYSSLLEALASTLDVRLSSEVTEIRRNLEEDDWEYERDVVITINDEVEQVFDAVVITPSLSVVPRFLDTTYSENLLFNRIETNRYIVTTFQAEGISTGERLYFYGNAFPDRINHVGVWFGATGPNGSFVGNAYQTVEWDKSLEELLGTLSDDVKEQGGAFLGLLQQPWSYFPHVMGIDVLLGYYDRLSEIQCRNKTAYTGSSLTFETVEHVARHAKYIVEDCFSEFDD